MDQNLNGMRRAVEALRDAAGKELEAQTIIAFLLVCEDGQAPLVEIQAVLNLSSSAASRNLGLLSATGYHNGRGQQPVEGLGWVEAHPDPMDRRRRTLRLTHRGRALATRLSRLLEAAR